MTHISTCLQHLLLDYHNKGLLDLDALIEVLEQKQVNGDPALSTDLSAPLPDAEIIHKIVALMELAKAPELERQKVLQNNFTKTQLEELQKVWAETVRQKLGIQQNNIDKQKDNIWRDYSKYRNGVQNCKVGTPCNT
jgi:hypothetical protein